MEKALLAKNIEEIKIMRVFKLFFYIIFFKKTKVVNTTFKWNFGG
jgi:hypothetical protein